MESSQLLGVTCGGLVGWWVSGGRNNDAIKLEAGLWEAGVGTVGDCGVRLPSRGPPPPLCRWHGPRSSACPRPLSSPCLWCLTRQSSPGAAFLSRHQKQGSVKTKHKITLIYQQSTQTYILNIWNMTFYTLSIHCQKRVKTISQTQAPTLKPHWQKTASDIT